MRPFRILFQIFLHFTAARPETASILLPPALLGLGPPEGRTGEVQRGQRTQPSLAPEALSLLCSPHSPLFTCLPLCPGMKRPLSPSPAGGESPVPAAAECPPRPPEAPKPKRERKRPSYTLCDVCNIQLNSAAQAQVHCGGRAHQRRLRQLSLEKTPPGPGQSGGALLPDLVLGPCRGLWVSGLSLWGPLVWGTFSGVLGSQALQRPSSFVLQLDSGVSQGLGSEASPGSGALPGGSYRIRSPK